MKSKLVICYNHFLPAYKAGGPIQSIANLIRNIHGEFDIYVITGDKDLNQKDKISVASNSWQDFENGKAKVFYLSDENIKPSFIRKLILEINPDNIFVNGVYSIPFSVAPAYYFPKKTKLHVRGMLHPGALEQKATKKKLFLVILNLLGIHKKITFCVSDKKEKEYTLAVFGGNIKVIIAQNFPASYTLLPASEKIEGELSLISIALISPMKNHELVLEALANVKSNITWHIYGPIKDSDYWERCKTKIAHLPQNISVEYKGVLNPNNVYETLAAYHLFILPSQSENFGHALYEAMIAGKPILTSHNTPWNLLEENNAGFNVELTPESLASAIENVAALNQTDYSNMVYSVRKYAERAINRDEIKRQYLELFK